MTFSPELDKDQIIADLSTERPQWILSAYGPGRNAPEQLFGGPVREQSFEEIHLLHRIAERSGNVQQAAQEAQQLVQQSEQQIQIALNNVDSAIDYILSAEKNHPNRVDVVRDSNSESPQNRNTFAQGKNPNAFQAGYPQMNQPFGTPSQPAPAFGAPGMGASAFGQPSALGTIPGAFGAPSQALGASPQVGSGEGAFGQPSVLGQKRSPFGAPSAGGFSSFANAGGAFGRPTQPAPSNPFGAPSQLASSGTFGASPQTAPADPFNETSSAPFGAASGKPPATAPFGAPSLAPRHPFGAPSQPSPNSFGETSAAPANPFAGALMNPSANPRPPQSVPVNPFGASSNNAKPTNSNPFGNPTQATSAAPPYTPVASGDTGKHPLLSSYATVQPNGRLTVFKGRQVIYRNSEPGLKRSDGSWEKIWFPQGAPPFYGDTEMEDASYDEKTKAAYMHLRQAGAFEEGIMPMLPPKREWCLWDF